jgi:hypothetical protein
MRQTGAISSRSPAFGVWPKPLMFQGRNARPPGCVKKTVTGDGNYGSRCPSERGRWEGSP